MKLLNKLKLTVAVFFAATVITNAQSYSIVPNDTIELTGYLEDLQTLSIEQHNLTANTLTLKWQKVSENVPSLWEASVCDNAFCYTTLLDSSTMNPVIPGDYGFLLLHITGHVNYGTAVVRYAVCDAMTPMLIDTLTFIMHIYDPAGLMESENINPFTINQNTQGIHINAKVGNNFHYLVIDASGKVISKGNSTAGFAKVSTVGFSNSIYSVSVYSNNKAVTKKISITK